MSESHKTTHQSDRTAKVILCVVVAAAAGFVVLSCKEKSETPRLSQPSPTPDTLSPKEHLNKARGFVASQEPMLAQEHLNAIPKTAAEYKEAQKLRTKVEAQLKRVEEAFKLGEREGFASIAEKHFLKSNMDVYVTLGGPNKTTITFKYVLMSRPVVYNITNDSNFMQQLRDKGFRKVIFTDGFYESWTYNL